ncbi:MAG: phosphodiester glycosidase family protein [Candidatus Marinimicrobia bacterium]|nr:phosphodiester glycosidase family protein [Candidatus Neomarinimicrobiota bacterium]
MIFYNHYYGSSTGTSAGGTEIRVRPVSDPFVNDTLYGIMEAKSAGGDISLDAETCVLSGSGSAADFLEDHYLEGDTLKVLLEMQAFEDLSATGVSFHDLPSLSRIEGMIGGFPTIVRNGGNYALEGYVNQGGGASFATELHPRTAIGFNADTSMMYMVVVDGRQSHSAGIALPDLADILVDLGAWRAMNFDGGGSSVMVVGHEVQNSPSDGVERSVRNCCGVYSTAPEGTLSRLQIELDTLKIYKNASREFYVSGWDEHYNPKPVPDWSAADIRCASRTGSVSGQNGTYTFAASEHGENAYVYADLDGISGDSMYVHIRRLDPVLLSPQESLTDTLRPVRFRVRGVDEDGDTLSVDNRIFAFSVADSSVGTVSADGEFTGRSPGSTKIYVRYGGQSDSARVTVVVGEGEEALDRMESLEGWELQGEALDTTETGIGTCGPPGRDERRKGHTDRL